MVYVLVLLPVMVGVSAFAVDWGRLQLTTVELQHAATAAARHAAAGLGGGPDAARDRAVVSAAENKAGGAPITLQSSDFQYGRWTQGTFTPLSYADASGNAVRVTLRRSVVTTFAGVFTPREPTQLSASAVAVAGRSALLVVHNASSPNASDTALRNRLIFKGLTPRLVSGSAATAASAAGDRLVVIAPSVTRTSLGNRLRNVAVPMIMLMPELYQDMGMTQSPLSEWGWRTNQTDVRVVHWFFQAFLGDYPVVHHSPADMGFGKPHTNAVKYMTIRHPASNHDNVLLFSYEPGVGMFGLTAPAQRVGFWSRDFTRLNATGLWVFDICVDFCVGTGGNGGVSSVG